MNNLPWNTHNEANVETTAADALALFDNAPEQAEPKGGLIPEGLHMARLESGKLEQSRKRNWCWCARWELTGGLYAGRRLMSRHWLTPKAVARTKRELGALGLTVEHLRGGPLPPVHAELSVKCLADECGNTFNEVKRVAPSNDAGTSTGTLQDGAQDANAGRATSTQGAAMQTSQAATQDAEPNADDSFLDDEFAEEGF